MGEVGKCLLLIEIIHGRGNKWASKEKYRRTSSKGKLR